MSEIKCQARKDVILPAGNQQMRHIKKVRNEKMQFEVLKLRIYGMSADEI